MEADPAGIPVAPVGNPVALGHMAEERTCFDSTFKKTAKKKNPVKLKQYVILIKLFQVIDFFSLFHNKNCIYNSRFHPCIFSFALQYNLACM